MFCVIEMIFRALEAFVRVYIPNQLNHAQVKFYLFSIRVLLNLTRAWRGAYDGSFYQERSLCSSIAMLAC
jgi:hypothetical protein